MLPDKVWRSISREMDYVSIRFKVRGASRQANICPQNCPVVSIRFKVRGASRHPETAWKQAVEEVSIRFKVRGASRLKKKRLESKGGSFNPL